MVIYKAAALPVKFECEVRVGDDEEGFPRYGTAPDLPRELRARGGYRTFDVPVAVIVTKAGVFAPVQGRAWRTDLVLYCDAYVPYRVAEGRPMWDHSPREHAWVVEVWEDHGDDGHVRYEHDGYALVTEEQFGRLMARNADPKGWDMVPTHFSVDELVREGRSSQAGSGS